MSTVSRCVSPRSSTTRFLLAGAACVLLMLSGQVAAQEPPEAAAPKPPMSEVDVALRQTCDAAFLSGQAHRRDGRLREALRQLEKCMAQECGKVIESIPEKTEQDQAAKNRQECERLLSEVEATLPTIVVVVRDASGGEVRAATVRIDGERVDWKPGGAIVLDPGPHRIAVEQAGHDHEEQEIVAKAGDKNVKITFGEVVNDPLPPPLPPPPPPVATESSPSPLLWAGLGVAGAGAVVWAVAGGIAASRASDLLAVCNDDVCPPDRQQDLDDARLSAHVATAGAIITGAGAALAATGLILTLTGGDAPPAEERARFRPLLGPGYLGAAGSF